MPEITVLMPVRDGMPWVRRAVRSTLKALPRDAELRVVVDGGSDTTADFLLTVRDSRLVVNTHSSSQGVAKTLNEALRATDSRFVARMDADDVCLPWRFTRQTALIRHNDFVFSSAVFIDAAGRPTGVDMPGPIRGRAVATHLLIGNALIHPTMFARREVLEDLGGYDDVEAEDYAMWLKAVCSQHRLYRSAVPVLLYRKHASQVTKQSAWVGHSDYPVFDDLYFKLWSMGGGTSAMDLRKAREAALTGDFSSFTDQDFILYSESIRSMTTSMSWGQRRMVTSRLRARARTRVESVPNDA